MLVKILLTGKYSQTRLHVPLFDLEFKKNGFLSRQNQISFHFSPENSKQLQRMLIIIPITMKLK